MCNNFCTGEPSIVNGDNYEGLGLHSNGSIYLRIKKDKLQSPDVEGLKAWLKANKTVVLYKLKTPVIEVVEGLDLDIDIYSGSSGVLSTNTIPAYYTLEMAKSIGALYGSVSKDINKIWNKINKEIVPNLLDLKIKKILKNKANKRRKQ